MRCAIERAIYALAVALATIVNCANLRADEPKPRTPVNVDTCQGCHGIAGYRTAFPATYSVPKLGGQEAAYIVKALQDYKLGKRKHPSMVGIAATLSDEEIAALAAYYSGRDK